MHTPNKRLGQHWLRDETTLKLIADHAGLTREDTVLEVGPGLGYLTNYLTNAAAQVVAVELDSALANSLSKTDNLTVVNEDILKFDLTSLPADYKVVANIPYYLTSNLIRLISESPNRPILVVLLVQKEVADRVAAQPGQMSLLSVTAQYFWKVDKKEVVGASLFTPPPKVDSQVILLTRNNVTENPKELFRLVKCGFAARRKTIGNSLSAGLRKGREEIEAGLDEAKIDKKLRPQNLSIDDWKNLLKVFKERNLT